MMQAHRSVAHRTGAPRTQQLSLPRCPAPSRPIGQRALPLSASKFDQVEQAPADPILGEQGGYVTRPDTFCAVSPSATGHHRLWAVP